MIIREYYQPNAPDPILPDDQILALVRRHQPHAQTLTGVDESGGEARVYFIDGGLVMKVQRPPQLRSWTSLAKEAEFLRYLAKTAPAISIPRVLGHDQVDGVEYTLMTRMAGDAVVRSAVADGRRADMLQALGRTLRAIHSVPQEPLRESGLFPEEYTRPDLQASIAEDYKAYAEAMTKRGITWPWPWTVTELIEKALQHVPQNPRGVAVHSNPGPTHTFVDSQMGLFTGLIDFGDAYIGNPADDLARWPDPGDRQRVLEGYVEAGDPGPAFWSYWPVAEVSADLLYSIRPAASRDTCVQHLQQIVEELW